MKKRNNRGQYKKVAEDDNQRQYWWRLQSGNTHVHKAREEVGEEEVSESVAIDRLQQIKRSRIAFLEKEQHISNVVQISCIFANIFTSRRSYWDDKLIQKWPINIYDTPARQRETSLKDS